MRYTTARRAVRHNNASRVVNANFLRENVKVYREPRPTKIGAAAHQSLITFHFLLSAASAPQRVHLGPVKLLFQAVESVIANVAAATQLVECTTFCSNGAALNQSEL
jgi:hypothetical protein